MFGEQSHSCLKDQESPPTHQPSFLQNIVVKLRVCARHCAKCWGNRHEQRRPSFSSLGPQPRRGAGYLTTHRHIISSDERDERQELPWLPCQSSLTVYRGSVSGSSVLPPRSSLSFHRPHGPSAPEGLVGQGACPPTSPSQSNCFSSFGSLVFHLNFRISFLELINHIGQVL